MKARVSTATTQPLRNLIEDSRFGHASADELHNALLELERALQLPLTQPDPNL